MEKYQNAMTPWFPYNTRPKRKGWYEVRSNLHHRSKFHLTGSRRYFDGNNFRGGWTNESLSIFGTHTSHEWRGFVRKQT